MDFILLCRPVNLLFIALTMYAMRFCIMWPILSEQPHVEISLQMPEWLFFLSVLCMVLLAAAGNVINDYFDVRVDRINRPRRVIVGKTVKRRVAMVAHHVLNGLAILSGVIVCWKTGFWILAIVPVFMAGSLWYYSVLFKRQFLIGNFVVALMVGIVPLWAGVFESLLIVVSTAGANYEATEMIFGIWRWLLGFSLFAFVLTLAREAQKDIQDLVGDSKAGFRTFPIAYGISATKIYVAFLLAGVAGAVIWVGFFYLRIHWAGAAMIGFFVLAVLLPLLYSIFSTLRGNRPEEFGKASLATKVTMLGGILYAGVLYQMFTV